MQDNRRNTLLNGRLTITEAVLIAGMLITGGSSTAYVNFTMADTQKDVETIKELHKTDVEQMNRALNETELRLRSQIKQNKKEIREDLKEQSRDIKAILRALK